MAIWYCSSNKYNAVAQWAANTAYSVGDLRRQLTTPAQGNERVFRCTTPGTSGATEPAWVLAQGATTADGTVVWTEVTGNPAYGWNAPHSSIDIALDWLSAGDTLYVGNLHRYEWNSSRQLIAPSTFSAPCIIVCVNESTGAATTGAEENTLTSYGLQFRGNCYYYGITFRIGLNSNSIIGGIYFNAVSNITGNIITMDTCMFEMRAIANANLLMSVGGGSDGYYAYNQSVILNNCTFKLSSGPQKFLQLNRAKLIINGGVLQSSFDNVAALVTVSGNGYSVCKFMGVDLTKHVGELINTGTTGSGDVSFTGCKHGAGFSLGATTNGLRGISAELINSDSGSTINRYGWLGGEGSINSDTGVYRTGGAVVDGVPTSLRAVTSAVASHYFPLTVKCNPIYVGATGAAKTITIEVAQDTTAALSESEIRMRLVYLGTALSPLLSFVDDANSGPITPSATAQPASTLAWSGLTNPTKQFVSVQVTPQVAGYFLPVVEVAKPSTTVYIDPSPTVS